MDDKLGDLASDYTFPELFRMLESTARDSERAQIVATIRTAAERPELAAAAGTMNAVADTIEEMGRLKP